MNATAIRTELDRRLDPKIRLSDIDSFDNTPEGRYLTNAQQVKCADGFEMSVQASRSHYCIPRNSIGPWVQVEVGFPTAKVDAFMPYIDGGEDTDPTDTVYGYVPIDLVVQAIADHGGFAAAQVSA